MNVLDDDESMSCSDSDIEMSMKEADLKVLLQFNDENFYNQQQQQPSVRPKGDVLSTALNMVHLPTEIASINEMGEIIDSMDTLPTLVRQESGISKGTLSGLELFVSLKMVTKSKELSPDSEYKAQRSLTSF